MDRTVATDVGVVAVGDLLGDGGSHMLSTDSAEHLWLLAAPTLDGAEPLPVEGVLPNVTRVLDLGGDGRDEILSTTLDDSGNSRYAMHDVEPCA